MNVRNLPQPKYDGATKRKCVLCVSSVWCWDRLTATDFLPISETVRTAALQDRLSQDTQGSQEDAQRPWSRLEPLQAGNGWADFTRGRNEGPKDWQVRVGSLCLALYSVRPCMPLCASWWGQATVKWTEAIPKELGWAGLATNTYRSNQTWGSPTEFRK